MTEQGSGGQDDRDRDEAPTGSSAPRPGTSETSRSGQAKRPSRARRSNPGADMLNEFQRWLIRSSAKNMRKEIGGQVRKTLGGGRADTADVWDTATTEDPADAGEAPECQWCPICRAARRMRETRPGLGDQLSSATDVVSAAVQEAFRAFESVVNRSSGQPSRSADSGRWEATPEDWAAARNIWAAEHGAQMARNQDGAAQETTNEAEPEMTDEPDGPDEPDDRS